MKDFIDNDIRMYRHLSDKDARALRSGLNRHINDTSPSSTRVLSNDIFVAMAMITMENGLRDSSIRACTIS